MKKKLFSICIISAFLCLLLASQFELILADSQSHLEIINLSGRVFDYTYEQLLEMPKTVVNADLYCDGALATYGNWSGVLVSYLLTQAQVTPEVNSIHLEATDGYKVAIPMDLAMDPQIILAYEKDDQPLVEGLRLIVPGANGAAWIALISSITMSTSGADYPPAVTAGIPKVPESMLEQNNAISESSSYQQEEPIQSSPIAPTNSPSIQATSPANVTQPNQPITEPQISNESLSFQAVFLYFVILASFSLTITTYMVYRRKRTHASKIS
jgi:DMSO/TMAO reductase YedYZ molybdopterin-dependent catalytic subunit